MGTHRAARRRGGKAARDRSEPSRPLPPAARDRGARQDHALAGQPRLRPRLRAGLCRGARAQQRPPGAGREHHARGRGPPPVDRARPPARRLQPFPRLRQPLGAALRLLRHERGRRGGGEGRRSHEEQVARRRRVGLPEPGHPVLGRLEPLLQGHGGLAALGDLPVPAALRRERRALPLAPRGAGDRLLERPLRDRPGPVAAPRAGIGH